MRTWYSIEYGGDVHLLYPGTPHSLAVETARAWSVIGDHVYLYQYTIADDERTITDRQRIGLFRNGLTEEEEAKE